jgi:hypothetical protein
MAVQVILALNLTLRMVVAVAVAAHTLEQMQPQVLAVHMAVVVQVQPAILVQRGQAPVDKG